MAQITIQHLVTMGLYFTAFVDFVVGQESDYVATTSFLRIARFVIPVIILIAICIGGGACCCRRKRLAAQRAAQQQGRIPIPVGQINGNIQYPTTGVPQSQNDYSQMSGHSWGQPYVIQPPADNKDSSAPPPAYIDLYPTPPPYPGVTESSANPSVK